MPKALQNPKITQRLVKAFDLKGRYLPMLDEVVVPVYIIEDPGPAEPNRLAGGTGEIQAALEPVGQLFNPAGSGVLIVVTSANATAFKTGGTVLIFPAPVSLSTVQMPDSGIQRSTEWRDTRLRLSVSASPLGEITMGTRTTLPAGTRRIFQRTIELGGPDLSDVEIIESPFSGPRQPPIVLSPGNGLNLEMQSGGSMPTLSLTVNYVWEEIPLIGSVAQSSGTPP